MKLYLLLVLSAKNHLVDISINDCTEIQGPKAFQSFFRHLLRIKLIIKWKRRKYTLHLLEKWARLIMLYEK